MEVTTIRLKPGGTEPQKSARPERYSMTRDVRKEFTGIIFCTFKDKQDSVGGGGQASREMVQMHQTRTFMP